MFSIYCPRHQAEVLLGARSIESLVNTPEGVVLHWRCRCGARGTEVMGQSATGHRHPTAEHSSVATAA